MFIYPPLASLDPKDERKPGARVVEKHDDAITEATEVGTRNIVPRLDYAGAHEKIDPEEIKLVRRLDLMLIPILSLLNFMNLFNRQAISVARLDSLEADLGMSGTNFSTAVSVHYATYIFGQIPSNMLLTRLRPSWCLCGSMTLTGIVTVVTAHIRDYKDLIIVRVFLGFTAATYYPGAVFVFSTFYKRKELATRVSIMYAANILSAGFQGLLAAPIFSELGGDRGIAGWRWMYIICGSISIFLATMGLFIVPDEPLTARWLTTKQRQLAHDRIIKDTVERREKVSVVRGLKEAVRDYRVWIFAFMHHFHTSTTSFRVFLPTLLRSLGYNTTITLVLTCPPYILASITTILISLSSGKFNERTWHMTSLKFVAVLGFVLACVTMNTGARYFSTFLFCVGTYPISSLTLSWVGSTFAQTKEKRAAAVAIANTSASMSLIWTPYLWPETAGPRYVLPMATSAGLGFVTLVCVWAIKWSLVRDNSRIRRLDESAVLFYAY